MDVVEFEILYKNLISIAEDMGSVLQKSSYSPNIRERLDASCAIYSANKRLMAQAEHIPVHLGSMHLPLKFITSKLENGDQIILNDPSKGGTHLPDVTLYKPIFYEQDIVAFTANRAHHADIGGATPGSMPGNSTELYQEGLIIPPVKFVVEGKIKKDVFEFILANTRMPHERKGDFMAQMGANNFAGKVLVEFISKYGIKTFKELEDEIFQYTKRIVENRVAKLPKGSFIGEDFLELDTKHKNEKVKIKVKVNISDKIQVDFNDTSDYVFANINAPLAVTHSAVFYFFRTLLGQDIPANSGFYDFFEIIAPLGSIVNAPKNAPIVGGNVETSQRIVDALLNAFSDTIDLPAQSHGTMNNIAFGNSNYTFYETLGGGAGGGNRYNGESGVHVYMTNTKNTPVEIIEATYPLQCLKYTLRSGSGGKGSWNGGEGIIKHYKTLEPCTFSIISDRRRITPKGVKGGSEGKIGENIVVKNGEMEKIDSKTTINLGCDDEVIIRTPGGGGYGANISLKKQN